MHRWTTRICRKEEWGSKCGVPREKRCLLKGTHWTRCPTRPTRGEQSLAQADASSRSQAQRKRHRQNGRGRACRMERVLRHRDQPFRVGECSCVEKRRAKGVLVVRVCTLLLRLRACLFAASSVSTWSVPPKSRQVAMPGLHALQVEGRECGVQGGSHAVRRRLRAPQHVQTASQRCFHRPGFHFRTLSSAEETSHSHRAMSYSGQCAIAHAKISGA
jgi:hypothetical protein